MSKYHQYRGIGFFIPILLVLVLLVGCAETEEPEEAPRINVNLLGCDTGTDITHGMGEVTNAYVTIHNIGDVTIKDLDVTLNTTDSSTEKHPNTTRTIAEMPPGSEQTLELTSDTTTDQNTGVEIVVVGNDIKEIITEKTCPEINPTVLAEKLKTETQEVVQILAIFSGTTLTCLIVLLVIIFVIASALISTMKFVFWSVIVFLLVKTPYSFITKIYLVFASLLEAIYQRLSKMSQRLTLSSEKGAQSSKVRLITRIRRRLSIVIEWLYKKVEPDIKAQEEKASINKSLSENEDIQLETYHGTQKCKAVLVGINKYGDQSYPNLSVCVNDAEALQQKLSYIGFDLADIQLFSDNSKSPNRNKIMTTLRLIAESANPQDLILFYFSGHGDLDNNDSYLVTADAKKAALSDTGLSISRIKEIMEKSPAKAQIIILDACHSGADFGGKGSEDMPEEFIKYLQDRAEGMVTLASCKAGEKSYEWHKKERSVFTHYLLEGLEGKADVNGEGFVTANQINQYVYKEVQSWAIKEGYKQTPTFEYKVSGEIILSRYHSIEYAGKGFSPQAGHRMTIKPGTMVTCPIGGGNHYLGPLLRQGQHCPKCPAMLTPIPKSSEQS